MERYAHNSSCWDTFGLVSLLNDISINAKSILEEEQNWYYLSHRLDDKGVLALSNSIYPKVNAIVRLGFELAYLTR